MQLSSPFRWRRAALIVGIPGLGMAAVAALIIVGLLLIAVGNGAVLGARDTASRSAFAASGVPGEDITVYRRAGAAANVPWQLLAALSQAQRATGPGTDGPGTGGPDTDGLGPFRIVRGTTGISNEDTTNPAGSASFIARRLARGLDEQGVIGGADLLTTRVALDQRDGFRVTGTGATATAPAADRKSRVVAALAELPVRNANEQFMSGVYDTALRWALGRGDPTCDPAPGTPPTNGADTPYPLPATHGFAGAEEPIDEHGRVPSGKGVGVVTWSQHAALGRPYRDFYITMRWNYAAWNWDGTSTAIDQAQFAWFAEKPRLVLVTNLRTGASIIAAALEAGPAPGSGLRPAAQQVPVPTSAGRARSAAPPTGTPASSAASHRPRWRRWVTVRDQPAPGTRARMATISPTNGHRTRPRPRDRQRNPRRLRFRVVPRMGA